MKANDTRLMALGGLAGPLLFSIIILICAGLRPGYSHISQFISELGASNTPNANLMNYAGFIPNGILLSSFGISLFVLLPRSTIKNIGSSLIILFGFGVFLAGIFSCDPGCPLEGSDEAKLHDNISAIAFISAIIGSGLLGISFRKLPAWRSLFVYSLATSVLSLVFLISMINSFDLRIYTGVWQRMMLLTLFIWCSIVGARTFRLAK